MSSYRIYQDIAERTGGDIYIGVVGPVRTGKSTFIKRFMEKVVLPRMEAGAKKNRAIDETPQSGSGKTVMTTEPKFVPEEAVMIETDSGMSFRLKLIDCVGFAVDGADGLFDENGERMVQSPWSEEPIPFEEAAEIGTKKVIAEHSTIGILVTTDASFGSIPRDNYLAAEKAVVREMKASGKPFLIVLNTENPESDHARALKSDLHAEYGVPVVPLNCLAAEEADFSALLEEIVLEFPLREALFRLPLWILALPNDNHVRVEMIGRIAEKMASLEKTGDVFEAMDAIAGFEFIKKIRLEQSDMGKGQVTVLMEVPDQMFFNVLTEESGIEIKNESDLLAELASLSRTKERYNRISKALQDVEETGYGIVSPELTDLKLEEPEIVKKAGAYGVKLKASAPSIHMIRANIEAEISPIVGSERQSEDVVKFLLKEFEEDPAKIWSSDLFGKSLYELVSESLNTKLNRMPEDARNKLGETLQKIINEGSGGLICIIL